VVDDLGDTSDLPTFLQKAVADNALADADTARAFNNVMLVQRGLSEEDAAYVLQALKDIRAASGSAAPINDVFDLAHPNTKRWLDDATDLARGERALRIERRLANDSTIGAAAQRGAKKRVAEIEKRQKALRKKLGWTDENVTHPTVRIPDVNEVAAQRRLQGV